MSALKNFGSQLNVPLERVVYEPRLSGPCFPQDAYSLSEARKFVFSFLFTFRIVTIHGSK